MSADLTPRQVLLMWSLLATHGRALQGAIVPKVEKADRDALERRGFVAASKVGRAIALEMTDAGWAWAGDHLRDALPPAYQVLRDWLTRLHEHFQASGETLAAFIGAPPPSESPPPQPAKTRKPADRTLEKPKKPQKSLTDRQVRNRIEKAYLAATGGRKGKDAPLSEVRARIGDLDRATVDAGFGRILQGDPKARLTRIDNPRGISAAEREAAFNPGGNPFHILWIMS